MKSDSIPTDKGRSILMRIFQTNSFVFIFFFIVLAVILTHVVPAGAYEYVSNEAGQDVVVADSFHYVEPTPVSIISMFPLIVQAYINTADIIFCILFAYCFVGVLIANQVFDVLFHLLIGKLKNRTYLLIPIVTIFFAALGSLAGLAEETFGMFPVCIALALAMGYDEIVGASMVYVAVFTGFASATFNPYTIGVAQAIAGVPLYSGLGLRVICFVLFVSLLIAYTMAYAAKIKKNPSRSLMYVPGRSQRQDEFHRPPQRLTWRQTALGILFVGVIVLIIFGAMVWNWYLLEIGGVFLFASLAAAVLSGWSANQIGERFVELGSETMFSILIIGFANAIALIMETGQITDTIVHGAASLLEGTSGYLAAYIMLIVQNLLNFFIPSGPGQAAVSMPVMASLADVTGLSRQLSVLAFQFGDGYSNLFWPTMVCMMCGILKIPVGKWYRYMAPLFGLMFLLQLVMISFAVAIGY